MGIGVLSKQCSKLMKNLCAKNLPNAVRTFCRDNPVYLAMVSVDVKRMPATRRPVKTTTNSPQGIEKHIPTS